MNQILREGVRRASVPEGGPKQSADEVPAAKEYSECSVGEAGSGGLKGRRGAGTASREKKASIFELSPAVTQAA